MYVKLKLIRHSLNEARNFQLKPPHVLARETSPHALTKNFIKRLCAKIEPDRLTLNQLGLKIVGYISDMSANVALPCLTQEKRDVRHFPK